MFRVETRVRFAEEEMAVLAVEKFVMLVASCVAVLQASSTSEAIDGALVHSCFDFLMLLNIISMSSFANSMLSKSLGKLIRNSR